MDELLEVLSKAMTYALDEKADDRWEEEAQRLSTPSDKAVPRPGVTVGDLLYRWTPWQNPALVTYVAVYVDECSRVLVREASPVGESRWATSGDCPTERGAILVDQRDSNEFGAWKQAAAVAAKNGDDLSMYRAGFDRNE